MQNNLSKMFLLFYPFVIWGLVAFDMTQGVFLLSGLTLLLFVKKYYKENPKLVMVSLALVIIAFMINVSTTYSIYWERFYPVVMSAISVLFLFQARKHSESFIYPQIKKIKTFNLIEIQRLKKSENLWLVILTANFFILASFLFLGEVEEWVFYSTFLFYIFIAFGILVTVLYVHDFGQIFKMLGVGLSVLNHIQAFSVFVLMCLLSYPMLVILYILGGFQKSSWFELKARTISFYAFIFVKKYTKFFKVIDWEYVYQFDSKKVSNLWICNHICMFDIVAMFSEIKNCNTFVNQKFINNPLLNPIIRSLGYIPISPNQRLESKISGFEKAGEVLRSGETLVIFPEGTRSCDGELGVLQNGAFRLALEQGINLTPVIYTMDYPLLNKKQFFSKRLRGVKMKVYVLEPISVVGINNNREGVRILKDHFRKIVDEFQQHTPILGYLEEVVHA